MSLKASSGLDVFDVLGTNYYTPALTDRIVALIYDLSFNEKPNTPDLDHYICDFNYFSLNLFFAMQIITSLFDSVEKKHKFFNALLNKSFACLKSFHYDNILKNINFSFHALSEHISYYAHHAYEPDGNINFSKLSKHFTILLEYECSNGHFSSELLEIDLPGEPFNESHFLDIQQYIVNSSEKILNLFKKHIEEEAPFMESVFTVGKDIEPGKVAFTSLDFSLLPYNPSQSCSIVFLRKFFPKTIPINGTSKINLKAGQTILLNNVRLKDPCDFIFKKDGVIKPY